MNHAATSIRPFIGASDYNLSRAFYKELGFVETVISGNMCYFNVNGNIGFYLQDAYVKDWINNSMIFLEVDDVKRYFDELQKLDLPTRYKNVKLKPIQENDWGSECFLHDPSGVLWHIGQFH